jgi:Ca2+-binding RTX toxin-like protein
MKNVIRLKESRSVRPVWLSASAVTLAAVVAGAAGIAAGPGNATPVRHAAKASHAHKTDKFKHPKLKHGVITIEGTEASDKIALRLQAGDPGVLQVDVGDDGSADFNFERADVARIAVDAAEGNDLVRIDETNGIFTDSIPTTIDGGAGDDTIAGGKGAETLLGGDGNDSLDGNGGTDLALLGAGDDTFVWDPGDGSDTVEGQDGADRMLFNGANAAEHIDLSANGNRLRFFRDVANITMDAAGVERVDFNALGGADVVTVNDLTGTDVNLVNVDLAGTLGGATGDGQADRVVVSATNGDDAIDVSGDADVVKVSGLAPTIKILHSEVANDRLEINTLAGTDTVDTIGLAAGAIPLFVDGILVP